MVLQLAAQNPHEQIPYYIKLPPKIRAIKLLNCLSVFLISKHNIAKGDPNRAYYYAEVLACVWDEKVFLSENYRNLVVAGEDCDIFLKIRDNESFASIIEEFKKPDNNCNLIRNNRNNRRAVLKGDAKCYVLRICWGERQKQ